MPRHKNRTIEIAAKILEDRERSWKVDVGTAVVFLPKSVCQLRRADKEAYILVVPEWLAMKKGLLARSAPRERMPTERERQFLAILDHEIPTPALAIERALGRGHHQKRAWVRTRMGRLVILGWVEMVGLDAYRLTPQGLRALNQR